MAAIVVGIVGSTAAAEVDTAAWIATEEDTACWVEAASAVGVVETIPTLDLEGTSLAAVLMVEAMAVVALADCS
jgi:hypothetical protein